MRTADCAIDVHPRKTTGGSSMIYGPKTHRGPRRVVRPWVHRRPSSVVNFSGGKIALTNIYSEVTSYHIMAAFGDVKSSTAPCKWAQRTDTLYLTISLADVTDESIDVTEKSFQFSGKSNGLTYEVKFDFFKEIDVKDSIWKVLPNSVQMKLTKKEKDEEFWPRLTTDKIKEKNTVTIDWDRYVDEDEQDGDFDDSNLAGGQGMPGMGGMGGMPGMGGMGGGAGGMDPAALQAMMAQMGGGGAGGMPDMSGMGMPDMGDDEGDSDDDAEGMPDLEPSS
eukprot:GSChrysophyteH1.ASY1.ANO1.2138.1 assembled CDS